MATPPTLIANPTSTLNATTSPKSVASITVQTNDIIVVQGITGDMVTTLGTPTNTNTAQTWTLQKSGGTAGSQTGDWCWTAVASTNQAMVISITRGGNSSNFWGFQVTQWRGSDGVGASAVTTGSGAPSLSLTTTAANSAVCVQNGDWTASTAARTWRTVNSAAATELSYYADGSTYGFYAGYHPDAGAAGANTYGLSAPTGQTYTIIAIEVKGAAAGGPALPPELIMQTRRPY